MSNCITGRMRSRRCSGQRLRKPRCRQEVVLARTPHPQPSPTTARSQLKLFPNPPAGPSTTKVNKFINRLHLSNQPVGRNAFEQKVTQPRLASVGKLLRRRVLKMSFQAREIQTPFSTPCHSPKRPCRNETLRLNRDRWQQPVNGT